MKTDHEINEAIARKCGVVPRIDEYQVHSDSRKSICMSGTQKECLEWFMSLPVDSPYRKSDWQVVPHYAVPNYCSDLNAMHEAEISMGFDHYPLREKYSFILDEICNKDRPEHPLWMATARQRAEAFCRTVGIQID